MHVYVITNIVNGKIYVGQTSRDNLGRYFRQKISDAVTRKRQDIPLHRAFRKYGAECFIVESIFQPYSKRQMNQMERLLISALNSRDRNIGYNLTLGGDGLSGYDFSEDHCSKISKSLKGKKNALGVKRSQEFKDNLRRRMLGNTYGLGRKPSSEKHIAALRENSFATKSKEEMRAINELAQKARREAGYVVTEQHKQKISATSKGKPKSEETKQRMREAAQRRTPEYKSQLSKLANDARWKRKDNPAA